MPPSPLAPHGRARIFSILVGGFGRRGPISSPPLPSVALCALKDAALDLMRAPGRRAWLWALYPAPPCPPPQPRLRVRGGAPFFGGSKNHPLKVCIFGGFRWTTSRPAPGPTDSVFGRGLPHLGGPRSKKRCPPPLSPPMGAREFFPFWSGGLVGEGPYPAPPFPPSRSARSRTRRSI